MLTYEQTHMSTEKVEVDSSQEPLRVARGVPAVPMDGSPVQQQSVDRISTQDKPSPWSVGAPTSTYQ